VGEAYLLVDGRVLKILREDLSQDPQIRARFEAEVVLQSSVCSPLVPRVCDEGEHQGRPYFVMEHHPGVVLARCLEKERSLSVACIGAGLLDALSVCHSSGVVHRDVKADNVIVGSTGVSPRVSLIDFGVACLFRSGGRAKVQLGSPCTWGPERLLGSDGADVRSDLFSAGVLLFSIVANAHPFGHATPAWKQLLTRCETPPLRAFVADAAALDGFFQKALAKEIEERFSSASSMRDAWREGCAQASYW
jgi:serine/threonine protein kinase